MENIKIKKSFKMKSKILLIGVFIITFVGITNAEEKQNDTIIVKGSYKFNQDLPKSISNQKAYDNTSNGQKYLKKEDINKGNKIIVLYKIKDTIYFKYLIFKDSILRGKYNGDKIFSMPKKEFKELTSRLYRIYKGVVVGGYTVPFRLRGIGDDNFDFETVLSVQANVVVGLGPRISQRSWIDLSFGFGISQVNLNSKNSSVIKEDDSMTPLTEGDSMTPLIEGDSMIPLTEDRTASAFTISFGAVFKFAKDMNLGIFFGYDFLGLNDNKIEWEYDRKLWIGLGINVTFDDIKTTETINKSKQNN